MTIASTLLFAITATALSAAIGMAALWSLPAPDGDLFAVVAPPWDGGSAGVVQRAGGREIGPERGLLAVLATDTTAAALRRNGAWLVLAATPPESFLCLASQGPAS